MRMDVMNDNSLETFSCPWNLSSPSGINPVIEISSAPECTVCNDSSDQCPACTCPKCWRQVSAEKRFKCFMCKHCFHEWCRTNYEPCTEPNQWLCGECKETTKPRETVDDAKLQQYNLRGRSLIVSEATIDDDEISIEEASIDQKCFVKSEGSLLPQNVANQQVTENAPEIDALVDKVTQQLLHSSSSNINNIRRKRRRKRVRTSTDEPPVHYGPKPGIPVGSCWKLRQQVAEAGVHRPTMAGIAYCAEIGADSIVLSGMYEQDNDLGDEFYYSGCGGNKKEPNKRLGTQIRDQQLTRHNRALAISCNAPLNDVEGAKAVNWRDGKPVRVIRNDKLKRYSIYAPDEGYRYDGIYKVVEYFPIKNKAGLRVWRYLMRRDDLEPAPWTEEGKRLIEQRNLKIKYPESYNLDENTTHFQTKKRKHSSVVLATKCEYGGGSNNFEQPNVKIETDETYDVKPNVKTLSRNYLHSKTDAINNNVETSYLKKSSISDWTERISIQSVTSGSNISTSACRVNTTWAATAVDESKIPLKKRTVHLANDDCVSTSKQSNWENEPPDYILSLINDDLSNKFMWEYCMPSLSDSKKEFLENVKIAFMCLICKKLPSKPVTAPCGHNLCLDCMTTRINKKLNSCPSCRVEWKKTFVIETNKQLDVILKFMFPENV